jgi:hypothetical protein
MNPLYWKARKYFLFFDSGNNCPGGPLAPGVTSQLAEKIMALLDQIRAIDKTMDEARSAKIANIKKAIRRGYLSCQRLRSCSADHRPD